MGSTLEQICGFLASEELQYRIDTDRNVIVTGFGTENYIDDAGDKNLGMIIQLEENGEFLKIFTPKCYSVLEETNRAALMQTLLMVSWKTKMIQFEYDDTDGEVRAIIEYPLEDADLTRRQLLRSVQSLVQIVDKYHPVMFKALREGVIEFEASENPLEELQNAFSRFEQTLLDIGIDVDEILEESVQESDTETNNRDAEDEGSDDDDEYI